MGTCRVCGKKSRVISNVIGVCVKCLRESDEALAIALEAHRRYRSRMGLPLEPPRDPGGVKCSLCVNACSIPHGGIGFCGMWVNEGGRLVFVEGHARGVLHAYLDPLPTNCVATPVCSAATGAGYPRYSVAPGPEHGYYNLAVFFAGCNLDCIFCQNWSHKDIAVSPGLRKRYLSSVEDLVNEAIENSRVTCICFFGGDPAPHSVYATEVSRKILAYSRETKSVKRICWETNGLENPTIIKEMARLSLESGGIVKIDWKAFTPQVYQALTGVSGKEAVERVKKNIELVAGMACSRPEIPLLVVSVLLVPGYVDEEELAGMARYIASVDRTIPVVLLAFHPDHLLRDLPPTSFSHAEKALSIFREYGVEKVFVGNEWLLGAYY
uniref:Radical SAM protein n=1 Tax=Ignisphaera aggregans TaxID=334771 RepID=A0A7C2VI07_9CREN